MSQSDELVRVVLEMIDARQEKIDADKRHIDQVIDQHPLDVDTIEARSKFFVERIKQWQAEIDLLLNALHRARLLTIFDLPEK